MSEKIYGIPIATPINPKKFGAVKTVNGVSPDENGNVEIEIGETPTSVDIPEFDLASMGLPALPVEGGTVECVADTSELRAALSKGTVKLRGQVQNLDGDIFYGTAVATPTFSEEHGIYELSITFAIYDFFVTAVIWVYEDGLRCEVRHHGSGTADFETDDTLKFENGVLSVNTTSTMEENNTLPITSAAVYTVVGNINAILDTI